MFCWKSLYASKTLRLVFRCTFYIEWYKCFCTLQYVLLAFKVCVTLYVVKLLCFGIFFVKIYAYQSNTIQRGKCRVLHVKHSQKDHVFHAFNVYFISKWKYIRLKSEYEMIFRYNIKIIRLKSRTFLLKTFCEMISIPHLVLPLYRP